MSDRGRADRSAESPWSDGSVRRGPASLRIRRFDVLALINLTLWALMAWFVYRRRLALHRGEPSLTEFFFYATLSAVVLALIWAGLRRFLWHPALLVMVEIALLSCFAGALVLPDGTRLYDQVWLSIRFDKVVHFSSALVLALVTGALFNAFGIRLRRLQGAVIVLVVLGGGTLWEIVEYLVVKTFPENGVGLYDNNMQDLIANLAGGLSSRVLPVRWREAIQRVSEAAPATVRTIPAPVADPRPIALPRRGAL